VIKSGYYRQALPIVEWMISASFSRKTPRVEKEMWRRQSSDDERISNRSFAVWDDRVDLNFTTPDNSHPGRN
jgi:hypothetical protein